MIIYQSRIYRADLRNNPEVLFCFGDNAARFGMGGQAKEMRGEPNAIGIATKKNAYQCYTDADYDEAVATIEADLIQVRDAIFGGRIIIFPIDGIGTGLAYLEQEAPKIWAFLCSELKDLGIRNGESI